MENSLTNAVEKYLKNKWQKTVETVAQISKLKYVDKMNKMNWSEPY